MRPAAPTLPLLDRPAPSVAGMFKLAPRGHFAAALARGTLVVSASPAAAKLPRATCEFGRQKLQPAITQFAWLPERTRSDALVCLDRTGRAYRLDVLRNVQVPLVPNAKFRALCVGNASDAVALRLDKKIELRSRGRPPGARPPEGSAARQLSTP